MVVHEAMVLQRDASHVTARLDVQVVGRLALRLVVVHARRRDGMHGMVMERLMVEELRLGWAASCKHSTTSTTSTPATGSGSSRDRRYWGAMLEPCATWRGVVIVVVHGAAQMGRQGGAERVERRTQEQSGK